MSEAHQPPSNPDDAPVEEPPGEEIGPETPVDYSTSPFESHPIDVLEEGAIDEQSFSAP
jgi:hypothetical protein